MKGYSVLTINGGSWSIKFAVCETGATTTRLLALTFGQLGFLALATDIAIGIGLHKMVRA